MVNKNFKVLFYLKKPKDYKSGKCPIYLRVTVDGQRFELASKRDCEPEKWNASAGRKIGQKEDVRSLNAYLESMQVSVFEIQRTLLDSNKVITAQIVRDKLRGVEEKPIMILDVFKEHNEQMHSLVGRDYTLTTYNRYEAALGNVKKFLLYKFKVNDLPVHRLDFAFISDYALYLKVARKISHNTAMRYLKYIKKVALLCVKYGWLHKDPFFAYRIAFKDVDRRPLDSDELLRISEKNFNNYRLQRVRDIFLFCCYTGLAYVDVKVLRRSDVIVGFDGKKWVSIKRQKTGTPSRIPLLEVPMKIIERYEDDPAVVAGKCLLPVLTNQKMNSYLKEIGDVCQINRPITFHLARHTFATTITLSNDVPIETVSKMLGHKDLKTTQIYAKIVDRKISNDMDSLRSKLELRNSKII